MNAATSFMLGLLLTAVSARQLPAQAAVDSPTSSRYSGLSDAEAKAKFEREAVELRVEQRRTLERVAIELAALAGDRRLDEQNRQAVERIAAKLSQANDLSMALELTLQDRKQIRPPALEKYEEITSALAQGWNDYQQFKLDYQRALGLSIAKRWTTLSLAGKRSELSAYFALANQRPAWLLRTSPVNIAELIPKSAWSPVLQYTAEKNELLATAQRELEPLRNRSIELAQASIRDRQLSEEQRGAALAIAELLRAPYGRGLRGIMLCKASQELPDELRVSVRSLLQAFVKKVDQLQPAHARLLRDLDTRLEGSRRERLAKLKLEEQMVIDLQLAETTHLIQPLRVRANRSSRTNLFEDARLIELREDDEQYRYRVEFLIDGTMQWVDESQLTTHMPERTKSMADTLALASGPGELANDETDFSAGQVFAISARSPFGWKPVTVVDESALGVAVRWHGTAEPIEFYFPRHELRIVTQSSGR